jgi:hypothetical protein
MLIILVERYNRVTYLSHIEVHEVVISGIRHPTVEASQGRADARAAKHDIHRGGLVWIWFGSTLTICPG